MNFLNRKNVLYGLIALLALSVPLTVGILQRQQEIRSKAAASTTLSFAPNTSVASPIQKQVGDVIALDLVVTPGNNLVTFVKFQLNYDPNILEPVTPEAFSLNTAAFVSKDGPVISSGSLLASASVGSDPTKAIQKTTKVGTVYFKAKSGTNGSTTAITFGDTSQALSSATNDQASENVISTTSPVHINIGGYLAACSTKKFSADLNGGQEIPTNNGSANGKITIELLQEKNKANATAEIKDYDLAKVTGMFIYAPASSSEKGNQRVILFNSQNGAFANPFTVNNFTIPDDVITLMENGSAYVDVTTQDFPNGHIRGKLGCSNDAAPSQGAEKETSLKFELLLHGIGAAGDNPNPNGSELSNKNPLHPQRNIQVEIYDTNNILVSSVSGNLSLNFDEGNGSFLGTITIPPGFHEGSYNLKVKTDTYLRKRVPGIQQIKLKTDNKVPKLDLVAGDTNNDNRLNVLDYNAFLDCGYGRIEPLPIVDPNSAFNKSECQVHKPPEHVDIDDNGVINSFDYNLFLRELSVQKGD